MTNSIGDAAGPVAVPPPRRYGWRRLLGFNLLSATVLAIVGFEIGQWIGHQIGTHLDFVAATDQNDTALLLGYVLAVVGWLAGLGFLNYPFARIVGRPSEQHVGSTEGIGRYFRMTTDHKVVGLQYLVGISAFFFIGGLNAMLIRTELLQPELARLPARSVPDDRVDSRNDDDHDDVVGDRRAVRQLLRAAHDRREGHGVPARRVADVLAHSHGRSHHALGCIRRWHLDRLDRLSVARRRGADGHGRVHRRVRADRDLDDPRRYQHDRDDREHARARPELGQAADLRLERARHRRSDGPGRADPHLGLLMEALDRTASTSFFLAATGGSPFLYENIFWFFGHPEVYILALPGFGVVLEILPVFARKPLWGYRLAVAGMLGVSLLSFMVWQHHLFVSGINSDLRPFYMFTTELISVPTGFIFLVAMGTIWRARIRYTVPMLFSLAFFFNFLIGGISGVFLSDVPSDVSLHGSYFVMAHFHYTIMGGLVFAFFAGIYYWLPKMTGRSFNETTRQGPLLGHVHRVQLHVPATLRRRHARHAASGCHVSGAPPVAERLGLGLGVRASAGSCSSSWPTSCGRS